MAGPSAPWARYLAVGVPLAVGTVVLPAGAVRDVVYLTVALSGVVAVALGARRNRPATPSSWYLIAAGMATWIVGGAVYSWFDPIGDQHLTVLAADMLHLLTYPLVALGMILFARSRGAEVRATALLDTAILTVGIGLLSWVFLIEPAWTTSTAPTGERLLQIGYPVGTVVLVGALVRIAYAPGAGRFWSRVVAIAASAMLALQAVAQASGEVPAIDVRPGLLDPRWLLAFVIAGAAALHPSMRLLSAPAPPRATASSGRGELLGLAAALLMGPVILGGQLLLGEPVDVGPVVVASTLLVGLVTSRMLRQVQHEHDRATTDDLTGLPNRRALYNQAASRLTDPQRRRQALLMLDLDRFKEVNDSLGHHAGDQLLVQVGDRLSEHLRGEDLLVRLGGDEFAILLADSDHERASAVAQRLSSALDAPFPLTDMGVHSTVSIGIALFPEHGTDLGTLLRKADIAMYRSKASGAPHLYGGTDDGDGAERLRLATELRVAMTTGQLTLHYQPKIDLVTDQVHGVEALVRWEHPTRGLLYPDAFLDLVEELGLMRTLTREVLTLALDQAVVWRSEGRALTVAVNLSASSVVDADLPDEVAAMLTARGLPTSALQLEITEEFLMADKDRARAVLTRLRDNGVQIAVDDFGTGYSSLSYLRDLPIDELKLDRAFVMPMADDSRATALVASTIALAHSLDLRMVAEGVEDDTAFAELTRLGCDQAQGYFMSRPLPAAALDEWLADRVTRVA